MLPRKILKIETVKYAFFNVMVNDSTHSLQEKNRPKNVHSFLRSEENYRRMNNLNALYTDFFVWITACHERVHEKWQKDTEQT